MKHVITSPYYFFNMEKEHSVISFGIMELNLDLVKIVAKNVENSKFQTR